MAPRELEVDEALGVAAKALHEEGIAFALIGGLAVGVRAQPRFTRDADLAVSVADDEGADRVGYALRSRGFAIEQFIEHTTAKRVSTLRTRPPGESGVIVDLLFASSGIEPEVVRGADELEVFPGVRLRVAKRGHLLALKVLSRSKRRPQDDLDLFYLLQASSPADRRTAVSALKLIEKRGFHRGKKLLVEWKAALRRAGLG